MKKLPTLLSSSLYVCTHIHKHIYVHTKQTDQMYVVRKASHDVCVYIPILSGYKTPPIKNYITQCNLIHSCLLPFTEGFIQPP